LFANLKTMSRLQLLLREASAGLPPWQNIPQSKWADIARQCSDAEAEEIRARIASLETELLETEEWDGDTRDDIHEMIWMFNNILAQIPLQNM